jgi:hypothetical protein
VLVRLLLFKAFVQGRPHDGDSTMGYRVKDEKRWPDRKIPYVFHANMMTDQNREYRELILACMARWEEYINEGRLYVRFVERTNEQKYVEIQATGDGSTGSGEIGMPVQGNISRFTLNTYKKKRDDRNSIPHELGHVLGLAHEQQRARPTFDAASNTFTDGTGDEVETGNAAQARLYYLGEARLGRTQPEDKKKMLDTWTANYVTVGAYDVQSIMHYPDAANWQWSYPPYRERATAVAALNYPSVAQVVAGTWEPSIGDLYAIRDLYP